MATDIVFGIEDIKVGRVFMWAEPGNNTFVVRSLVLDPQAGFAGNMLSPYARVKWSDENHETTMNIASIVAHVRTGLLIPTD